MVGGKEVRWHKRHLGMQCTLHQLQRIGLDAIRGMVQRSEYYAMWPHVVEVEEGVRVRKPHQDQEVAVVPQEQSVCLVNHMQQIYNTWQHIY